VQAVLLPAMAAASARHGHPGDLCVAAPTGSGKTLAYVLPIVHALRTRVVVRLRALVLLPTRELVAQVVDVFQPFCDAVGLCLGAATGHMPFAAEARQLVPTTPAQRCDARVAFALSSL
jgi:ATP-dependent RNA helicase DDX51/DBP6